MVVSLTGQLFSMTHALAGRFDADTRIRILEMETIPTWPADTGIDDILTWPHRPQFRLNFDGIGSVSSPALNLFAGAADNAVR